MGWHKEALSSGTVWCDSKGIIKHWGDAAYRPSDFGAQARELLENLVTSRDVRIEQLTQIGNQYVCELEWEEGGRRVRHVDTSRTRVIVIAALLTVKEMDEE